MRTKKVIVLGGGVAGLSAAHELVERGYEVEVFDKRPRLGGKASSQYVARSGLGGRQDLPGEHGFRFYPSFYRNLIDTMQRIPTGPSGTVADSLVSCTEAGIALQGRLGVRAFARRAPSDALDIAGTLDLFFGKLGVRPVDVARFTARVLRYLVSCRRRRLEKYERVSWWDYVHGDRYDALFQRHLRAVPRVMVAMDARHGSARTIGDISMQLIADYCRDGARTDRTLVGPTSEKWIDPWSSYLESRGAHIHPGRGLDRLEYDPIARRVTGAVLAGSSVPVTADYYVLALPLEAAVHVVSPEMAEKDSELAQLSRIRALGLADCSRVSDGGKMLDWMVGLQLFLREDVKTVRGHVFYPDSPWALSSISQPQFWEMSGDGLFRDRYGDGSVGGLISVDISDWNRAGTFVKKPAKHCTREEIKTEVWEQLKAALNAPGSTVLRDEHLRTYHLDAEIEHPTARPDRPINHSPLLVHPPGSWDLRPTARTETENLVLASDYVRTETILACMEGANEAARRAVNAILEREGGERCATFELEEHPVFDRWKQMDERSMSLGRPVVPPRGLERLWADDDDLRPFDLAEVRTIERKLTKPAEP